MTESGSECIPSYPIEAQVPGPAPAYLTSKLLPGSDSTPVYSEDTLHNLRHTCVPSGLRQGLA